MGRGGGQEGRGGDQSWDGLRAMEAKGSNIYINEGVGRVRKQKGECAADKESRAERGGRDRMEHLLSKAALQGRTGVTVKRAY